MTARRDLFHYTEESLEALVHQKDYVKVTSVEQASQLIKEGKVDQKVWHVVGQLAFGVELQALEPHPNPMNTKWLADFITAKVDVLKSVRTENREYQDQMEKFQMKMLGHTMTMNTASAMKGKILRAINQIAEEFES